MFSKDLLHDCGVGVLACLLTASAFALLYLRAGWPHSVRGVAVVREHGRLSVEGQDLSLVGVDPTSVDTPRLRQLVEGRELRCSWRSARHDRAECSLNGADLNERLLSEGVAAFSGDAVNPSRYDIYLRAEFRARTRAAGVWGGPADRTCAASNDASKS